MSIAACQRLVFVVLSLVVMSGYAGPDSESGSGSGSGANPLPVIETTVLQLDVATDSVSIPRTALTTMNGIPGVFVVQNGQARFRTVRPGKTGAAQIQVLSGLFGNETLVTGGLEAVHDGSPLSIQPPATKP